MKTISSRLGTVGLGFALAFFWASSPAEAISITSIVVTNNGVTYNSASVGWTFPVNLSTGQDLVVTQDFQGLANTTTSYNFDTSDNSQAVAPFIPRIDITVDGITTSFFDTLQVLNVKNQGSVVNRDHQLELTWIPPLNLAHAAHPILGDGIVGGESDVHGSPYRIALTQLDTAGNLALMRSGLSWRLRLISMYSFTLRGL